MDDYRECPVCEINNGTCPRCAREEAERIQRARAKRRAVANLERIRAGLKRNPTMIGIAPAPATSNKLALNAGRYRLVGDLIDPAK